MTDGSSPLDTSSLFTRLFSDQHVRYTKAYMYCALSAIPGKTDVANVPPLVTVTVQPEILPGSDGSLDTATGVKYFQPVSVD